MAENMQKTKIIFILIISCIFFLLPIKAKAGSASNIADKTIEFTAKTAYYITKYTLKSGWFLTRKTAKGIQIVTMSVYSASKDAFSSSGNKQPLKRNPRYLEYDKKLPPPPPIID